MKKNILISLFFVFAALSGPAVWAQQLPASAVPDGESLEPNPKLMIDEPVFEAGDIKPGTLLTHEFILRNEGDAPLEFSNIQTGCSCTLAEYDRVIAPGGSGKIKLSVRIYEEWAGRHFSRSTWLESNDPVSPQMQLVVKGDVLPLGGDGRKKSAPAAGEQ